MTSIFGIKYVCIVARMGFQFISLALCVSNHSVWTTTTYFYWGVSLDSGKPVRQESFTVNAVQSTTSRRSSSQMWEPCAALGTSLANVPFAGGRLCALFLRSQFRNCNSLFPSVGTALKVARIPRRLHDKNVLVSARLCGNHHVNICELAGVDALNPRLLRSLTIVVNLFVISSTERATTTGAMLSPRILETTRWGTTGATPRRCWIVGRSGANNNNQTEIRRRKNTSCKDNTSKDPFSQCEFLQGIRVQVKNWVNGYSDNNWIDDTKYRAKPNNVWSNLKRSWCQCMSLHALNFFSFS